MVATFARVAGTELDHDGEGASTANALFLDLSSGRNGVEGVVDVSTAPDDSKFFVDFLDGLSTKVTLLVGKSGQVLLTAVRHGEVVRLEGVITTLVDHGIAVPTSDCEGEGGEEGEQGDDEDRRFEWGHSARVRVARGGCPSGGLRATGSGGSGGDGQ